MNSNYANAIDELMDAANAAYEIAEGLVGSDVKPMEAFIMGAVHPIVMKYAYDYTVVVDGGRAYMLIKWEEDTTFVMYPLTRSAVAAA